MRPETPADADRIRDVTRVAFTWDDGAAENAMIDRFRASPDYRAGWSLVAEQGSEVVGHVMIAPVRLLGGDPHEPGPRRALMLGPISVLPERQRQGIGRALMLDVMARVAHSGEALVVLWGHPEYYPRFGFRRASDLGLLPDAPEAMACPLQPDLSAYAGLELPH